MRFSVLINDRSVVIVVRNGFKENSIDNRFSFELPVLNYINKVIN